MSDGPLIVQSDKTLLLEVDHPQAKECRAAIAPFAELERSPEHVHTYRVTPLALWNARAAGRSRAIWWSASSSKVWSDWGMGGPSFAGGASWFGAVAAERSRGALGKGNRRR